MTLVCIMTEAGGGGGGGGYCEKRKVFSLALCMLLYFHSYITLK